LASYQNNINNDLALEMVNAKLQQEADQPQTKTLESLAEEQITTAVYEQHARDKSEPLDEVKGASLSEINYMAEKLDLVNGVYSKTSRSRRFFKCDRISSPKEVIEVEAGLSKWRKFVSKFKGKLGIGKVQVSAYLNGNQNTIKNKVNY
jgi:hypothetical protein